MAKTITTMNDDYDSDKDGYSDEGSDNSDKNTYGKHSRFIRYRCRIYGLHTACDVDTAQLAKPYLKT